MSDAALQDYLARIDPIAVPGAVALDQAVRAAHPGFDVAVKYGLLMYALAGDWRTWVCAIGTTKKGVCLRFLYGVLLDDPRGVLRGGSSVLMSWDVGFDEVVDRAAVGGYVQEAVARYAEYKANAREVLETSRTADRGVEHGVRGSSGT